MGGVDIQRTSVQGESNRVVVQCRVSGRVVLDKSVRAKWSTELNAKKWEEWQHTVWIGVFVNLATNSWTYPIP